MGTTKVVYAGQSVQGVELADTGQFAHLGRPLEVDEDLAGRPPSGTPGEDGFDPGSGLLAGDFARPGTKRARDAAARADAYERGMASAPPPADETPEAASDPDSEE